MGCWSFSASWTAAAPPLCSVRTGISGADSLLLILRRKTSPTEGWGRPRGTKGFESGDTIRKRGRDLLRRDRSERSGNAF